MLPSYAQDALGNSPDAMLPKMAANPTYPVTSADVMGEIGKRNALRMGGGQKADLNPMGAKPMGQPPQPIDQGVGALPAQNLAGMKSGGIVPRQELPKDKKALLAMLHGEVARRKKLAQGGIVKHFDGGGSAKKNKNSGYDYKDYYGPEVANNDPVTLSKIFAALGGDTSPVSPNATGMGDKLRGMFGLAPTGDVSQAAVRESDNAIAADPTTPIIPAPVGVPKLSLEDALKVNDAARPPGIVAVLPKGQAGKGGGKGAASKYAGVDALVDDALYGDEPTAEATAKQAKTMADYIKEMKDATGSDPEIAETKKRIAELRAKNEERDPLQMGILSGLARFAASGGRDLSVAGGIGAGLLSGLGGYQTEAESKRAAGLKIDSEDLKRLSDQIASNKVVGMGAVQMMHTDQQSEKAARVAATMQAIADQKERIAYANQANQMNMVMARVGAVGGNNDAKFDQAQELAAQKGAQAILLKNPMYGMATGPEKLRMEQEAYATARSMLPRLGAMPEATAIPQVQIGNIRVLSK